MKYQVKCGDHGKSVLITFQNKDIVSGEIRLELNPEDDFEAVEETHVDCAQKVWRETT